MEPAPDHSRGPAGLDRAKAAKVGLRVFLVAVTSLFLLFLLAFIARSQMADWQPLTDSLAPLASARQLWLNTLLLVLGSISLQWARMAARRGVLNGASLGFALGGVFAIAFLGGNSGSGSSSSTGAISSPPIRPTVFSIC